MGEDEERSVGSFETKGTCTLSVSSNAQVLTLGLRAIIHEALLYLWYTS